jgi:hypothetical protein
MKQKLKKLILLLIIALTTTSNLFAQTSTQGTDFWLTFGQNLQYSSDVANLSVRIATNKNVTVNFEFTANSSVNTSVSVPAGTLYTHELTADQKAAVYNTATDGTTNNSLHVISSDTVGVYILNQYLATTDATNVLPVDNYGTDYYQISYQSFYSAAIPFYGRDGYMIIAQEDGTVVYRNGGSAVTLNRGQVYSYMLAADLTGTHVTSTKPVAYFVHNWALRVPITAEYSDVMTQQLPPVNQWGYHFVISPTVQKLSRIRVLASQDGTTITQTGGTLPVNNPGGQRPADVSLPFTLNAGEFVELEITTGACFISSDKPVGLCAYLVSASVSLGTPEKGDPSMTWLPPVEQSIRNVIVAPFIPTTTSNLSASNARHYALITVHTAEKSNTTVSIGGAAAVPISGVTWIDNVGGSGYSVGSYQLSNNVYIFDNPKGLIINGYGNASVESYYYLAGSGAIDFRQVVQKTAMCAGTTDILSYKTPMYTSAPYLFTPYWYPTYIMAQTADALTPLAGGGVTGATYPFTKNNTDAVEYVYIKLINNITNEWALEAIDTVKVYLAPDSLEWTGAVSNDWNNPANWDYLNNPDPSCVDCEPYWIPCACTNVLIPDGLSNYPDLTPGTTTYSGIYQTAACNHIWFNHGGEVVRTDSLHYTEAYVDLQILSNQWYMLSAPLRNMYTGDFYANSPNPFMDGDGTGLFMEPMFFNVANPETHKYTEYKWTGAFNTADVELQAGEGLALWAGDKYDYNHHDSHTFTFPKSDTFYKYYYPNGTESGDVTSPLIRTNKNRFIYEPLNGATYGDVPLFTQPIAAGGGQPILIGNPFMAHLKFDKFVERNADYIENEYKLAYGVTPYGDATNGKVTDFVTYKTIGETAFATTWDRNYLEAFINDIPPMQSFVVISKDEAPLLLKANITETRAVTGPDNRLRSSSQVSSPDYLLEITSEQNQQTPSKALLLYMENASNDYVPAEDSYKLFLENSLAQVLVYLRSADGYALDINSIGNLEQAVPLGIRTNQKGQIRLKFEGTDKFLDKANIFLHDTKANKVVNMSLYKEYTFNKDEDDLYVENRFYITFNNNLPTGIQGLESASVSIQNPAPQTLQILSNTDSPLGHVQITDLQGRIWVAQDVPTTSYTHQVKTPGVYIVRVTGKESVEVKKIIIK